MVHPDKPRTILREAINDTQTFIPLASTLGWNPGGGDATIGDITRQYDLASLPGQPKLITSLRELSSSERNHIEFISYTGIENGNLVGVSRGGHGGTERYPHMALTSVQGNNPWYEEPQAEEEVELNKEIKLEDWFNASR